MLQLMDHFYHQTLSPVQVPFDQTLKYMLQSGLYMPAESWSFASATNGTTLDIRKSEVLFSLMTQGTENTTIDQVRTLFFTEGYLQPEDDHLWSDMYPQIEQRVRDLRAGAQA